MPKLLIRPTLFPEEWWDGYVARALAENGYAATSGYMLRKLEPHVAQLVSSEVKRRVVAGDTLAETLCSYSRWTLPSWAVRSTKSPAAFCARCFHDEPYVRLVWRLCAVTHCDVHDQALQTRCSACSGSVFHWDLVRQVCCCGEAFGQAQTRKRRARAGVTAVEGSRDRENWLFSWQAAMTAITRPDGESGSESREALAVIVLMGRLLTALVEVRIVGLGDETRTTAGFMKALGLTLSPSMDSVKTLLETLPSAPHLRAALNVILALRHAERTGRSVLGQLPLEDLAEGLCALGASPEMAERRGLIEVGRFERALVPLKVAASRAGLGEMHLHSLMERGLVVPTRTYEVGGRQHLFSPAQVQFLTSFRQQGNTYGKALDLGVEGSDVDVLRAAGIVSIVPGSAGKTWLDGKELRALLAALSERAVEVQAVNAQMLNLGSKRIWQNRYVPVLKTLFAKLLAGRVALWAFGDRPGFARFYLGVDALELLHRGSVAGGLAGSEPDSQPGLVLLGGFGTWTPTPTPWTRRPCLGAPRSSRGTSPQLALDLL